MNCFLSTNISTDLYVVLKRFGAILWPETAFIGPLNYRTEDLKRFGRSGAADKVMVTNISV